MKFAHVTIMVEDLKESLKFYQGIVGLSVVRKFSSGPDREIVFLGEGGTLIELIYDESNKNINMGSDISIGFGVDSVDETMEFLQEQGIKIHSGPFQPAPGTKFFYVLDPNGLKVQFIQED